MMSMEYPESGPEGRPDLKCWENKIFDLLLIEELITQEVIDQLCSWRHSGFLQREAKVNCVLFEYDSFLFS